LRQQIGGFNKYTVEKSCIVTSTQHGKILHHLTQNLIYLNLTVV